MNRDFLKALSDIEKTKGISKDVLLDALEQALLFSYKKKFNTTTNVRVDINRDNGEMKVFARKMVVDDILDDRLEILLEDAQKIYPGAEMDQTIDIEVTPKDFGRLAAQTAKSVITQRIKEAERGLVFDAYISKEGDIITGKVHGMDNNNLYIQLDKAEGVLPLTDLPAGERYKLGEEVTAYISLVDTTNKGTFIHLSRVHPGYVKRLFELKIPEVQEGKVLIKSIAREAGNRSKVAVTAATSDVDAIAACVGVKGAVIQSIIADLPGEKIDIIKWSNNIEEYLANALAPARVLELRIIEETEDVVEGEEPLAQVIVPDDQLTLAIGVKGQNVRLAAKLTGYKLDLYSEERAFEVFGRPRTPDEV